MSDLSKLMETFHFFDERLTEAASIRDLENIPEGGGLYIAWANGQLVEIGAAFGSPKGLRKALAVCPRPYSPAMFRLWLGTVQLQQEAPVTDPKEAVVLCREYMRSEGIVRCLAVTDRDVRKSLLSELRSVGAALVMASEA